MLSVKRLLLTSLTLCWVLPLAACSNSSLGETLERSLAPDPRLDASPSDVQTNTFAELPSDFPSDIPRYPSAELLAVTPPADPAEGATETRWRSTDASDRVRQFYQDRLRSANWKIEPSAESEPLIAEKENVRVRMAIVAAASPTEFTLAYRSIQPTAASPNSSPVAAAPGSPDFIGPLLPPDTASEPSTDAANPDTSTDASRPNSPASPASQFTDIAQVPDELRPYIEDLAKLGVLSLSASNAANPTAFKPNQVATRREFTRWLVATNNRLYGDRPAQKIRLATAAAQPVFQDVPRTDPDFAAIQGLAEAGLIPSSLSGNATSVTFRPDAPLTRETLILWKTPVDLRQTLPTASIDAVQKTWGFQDAARIDPLALKAVLADYQNGDLSNIRRAFGYTTLFQPKKTVTRAEAAAVLWHFGIQGDGVSAKDALQPSANQ